VRWIARAVNTVLKRLLVLLSRRRQVASFDVREFSLSDSPPLGAVEKVAAALQLLATHSPVRFARIRRNVRRIIIANTAGNLAEYHHSIRACFLDPAYLAADDVTPALVAGTIAHEATHARLRTAGFGYPLSLRARIEKLCFEAENDVGRRMPGGEEVTVRAQRQLARDPSAWTDDARRARAKDALRKLGLPSWFLRIFGAHKPAALRCVVVTCWISATGRSPSSSIASSEWTSTTRSMVWRVVARQND